VTALLRFVGMPEDALRRSMSLPSWRGRVAAAHTIVREIRAINSYRFDPGRFGSVRVPTMLLAGSESPPDEVESCAAVAAALPDARTVTMAGQGHVAMTTGPELFAAEVLDFLGAGGR
jgi:pimeloyl-ACP methyl ester carboxylesterase